MTRDFRKLEIWKRAHQLAVELYKITKSFPQEELFALVQQIRRAGVSIGANVAEGCGQGTNSSMRRYLLISLGSIKELEYHILLSYDLGYLEREKCESIARELDELGKMTNGFISKMPKT